MAHLRQPLPEDRKDGALPTYEMTKSEARHLGNALIETVNMLGEEGIRDDGGMTMLALVGFPTAFNIEH